MVKNDPLTEKAEQKQRVEIREGQLSLLGHFQIHDFLSPVAICTLTDDALRDELLKHDALSGILVGSLHTENIGIEHLITYCVGNPNIRFIVVCGLDGKQAIGHLPGQSFLSLAQNGLDEKGRIIGAQGKRPVIQNVSQEAVEYFRQTVEVINLIGVQDIEQIIQMVHDCIERSPGVAEPFYLGHALTVTPIQGYAPETMITDPCGYFIINVDHHRGILLVEHYHNNGVFNLMIEGTTGKEIYFPIIEMELVSLLDHAAYLGRELERAEQALKLGQKYIQDENS